MSNNYEDRLSEKHEKTINDLKDLQEVEKYMFKNLQNIDKSKDGAVAQQALIKKRVDELSAIRIGLFTQLKNMYVNNQQDTSESRNYLVDQTTTNEIINQELENAKRKLKNLKNNYNNKSRLVKMGEYEYDRYYSHKSILKILVYGLAAILLIILLMAFIPIFPAILGKIFIVIIVSTMVYMSFSKIFYNMFRSTIDYDKFEQTYIKPKNSSSNRNLSTSRFGGFLYNLFNLDNNCNV